jgi:SAM-dependent methyltransferase
MVESQGPIASSPRRCLICGATREFLPEKSKRCSVCSSLARHRLLSRPLGEWFTLEPPPSILEVGPSAAFKFFVRKYPGARYLTLDKYRPADVQADVLALPFSAQFDIVIAYHVLEHIEDDGRAMRQLGSVLRPRGALIVQVPRKRGPTDEDPSLSPAKRIERFGQADHVRLYGDDIVDRFIEAGFCHVFRWPPPQFFSDAELDEYGLLPWVFVFVAVKEPFDERLARSLPALSRLV